MKSEIIEWIKSLGMALIIALIATHFIGATKVSGMSMKPTLGENDFLITRNSKKVNRGDVIIAKTNLEFRPEELLGLNPISKWKMGKTKKVIKRVIAVEGDSLIIENGKVILNNEELKESYILENNTPGSINIGEIPKDSIFVMGDNRNNSLDSRDQQIGLVYLEDVLGKAILRLYPFSEIGGI